MTTETMDGALAATAKPRLDDLHPDHPRRPGGSRMGRLMKRSRTRTAGIRFEWVLRTIGPVLRVVATWTDRLGQPHHTSFSVQCNGLEGALDRAIASRMSCGAPRPNREDLLRRLQKEFATAPYVADRMARHAPGRTAPANLFTQKVANDRC
ncbi:hypothetical protein [Roseateles sp.]|uniref:hypothetical protein n=1 Tax=Roseateles sp. TaxID=1971397 RepID=UPI0025CBA6D3|nr:hypothetical protein [Roseateles sp.]MBV8035416.1 hypothetical protein [Roseateles sp.]